MNKKQYSNHNNILHAPSYSNKQNKKQKLIHNIDNTKGHALQFNTKSHHVHFQFVFFLPYGDLQTPLCSTIKYFNNKIFQ